METKKYQSVLDSIKHFLNHFSRDKDILEWDLDLLQGLIDKEIGIKPVLEKDTTPGSTAFKYDCGCCGRFLSLNFMSKATNYCDECGTKINWDEAEEV